MVSLSVRLAGVELKNPVIPASGTFGYGREYAELYDLDLLGSFSWKGTTAQSRPGNPQPRIAETASGMLNAVGLQNPGIDAVIAEEVPNIAKIFHGPVIANVGGFSLQEYAENCAKLNDVEQVSILEVNISCPNVHAGGRNFGSDPKAAAEVTRAVKAVPQRHGHRGDRKGLRGRGSRRHLPHQHPVGDADRPENEKAPHRQPHRRTVRPRGVPGGGADGVGRVRGGAAAHHRLRRRLLCGGRV